MQLAAIERDGLRRTSVSDVICVYDALPPEAVGAVFPSCTPSVRDNADLQLSENPTMRHSALTRRLDVESARVWDIHYQARERREGRRGRDPAHRRRPRLRDPRRPSSTRPSAACATGARATGRRPATRPLREAIARHHEKTTGQPAGAENVVVFAGAQSALFSCVLCIADPGDEIAVFEPRYVTYDGVVDTPGAVRVDVPLAAHLRAFVSIRTRWGERSRPAPGRCSSTRRTIRPGSSPPARSWRRSPRSRSVTTCGC